MRRSKLEMSLDVLQVLSERGPLKLTHIMSKANVNCNVLKWYLDFLTKQGLVEEKIIRKEKLVYAITERGVRCSRVSENSKKYFRYLNSKQETKHPIRSKAQNSICALMSNSFSSLFIAFLKRHKRPQLRRISFRRTKRLRQLNSDFSHLIFSAQSCLG